MQSTDEEREQLAGYPTFVNGIPESDWPRLLLSESDVQRIRKRRGTHTQLGYGVQIVVPRLLGRFQTDMSRIPTDLVEHVGGQLSTVDPLTTLRRYAEHGDTVRAHAKEIAREDGWTSFAEGQQRLEEQTGHWLENAPIGPKALRAMMLGWLLKQRILLPALSTVDTLVREHRTAAEQRVVAKLYRRVSPAQLSTIDLLIEVPEGRHSQLTQMRSRVVGDSVTSLERALQRAEEIAGLGFADVDVSDIPKRWLTSLADRAMSERATRLKHNPVRHAAALAAIKHLETSSLDDAIDILDRLITGTIINSPQRWAEKKFLRSLPEIAISGPLVAEALLGVLTSVAEVIDTETGEISDPHIDTASTRALLETYADRGILAKAAHSLLTHLPARDSDTDEARRAKAMEQYPMLCRLVPHLVGKRLFGATRAGQRALAALDALPRLMGADHAGHGDIDPELLQRSWRRLVLGAPGSESGSVNLQAYALCVVETFHERLCARDIYVEGSSRWPNPKAGLLPPETWARQRVPLLAALALPEDAATYLTGAREELHATYARVDSRVPEGAQVISPDGLLVLPRAAAPRVSELSRRVDEMLPSVELPEVVLYVLNHIGGTATLTTERGEPFAYADLDRSVAAVLIGNGCNVGLAAVANDQGRDALTPHRLEAVSHGFGHKAMEEFNKLMLSAGASIPLAQHNVQRMASVDGMRFTLSGSQPHLRVAPQGKTEIIWMTVLTEQAMQLSGRMVSGRASAALEALSTLNANRPAGRSSTSNPAIVAQAGTHEDIVFGLLSLCGYAYQPTTDQITDHRLWRIDSANYPHLQVAPQRTINVDLVSEYWDEILHLIASIHHGAVSPDDALRILTRNGRPNQMGAALAAVGRMWKTNHLLNLYDDPGYRRGIEAQSRLHQARQKLAKRICHGIDGPFPEYQPGLEDSLGPLGLLLNAVALFNAIWIHRIVEKLRAQGWDIADSEARQLDLLRFGHINMRGRFHFDLHAEGIAIRESQNSEPVLGEIAGDGTDRSTTS
ncbi:Tn3 family transposase [Streptomyces sp. NPDC048491]|uniref:Tn3 family transposase n=1 Tax=Streptomyces sp. NPDC048491 TaxID=3157207 RepID=UPI00342AED1F